MKRSQGPVGDIMPENYKECSKCGKTKWVVILPDEGPICPKCLFNNAYGRSELVILRMVGFLRDFHNHPVHDGKRIHHKSYRASLHSMEKDIDIPYKDNMYNILTGLPEGTVVEISVKVLGCDERAVKDPIVWYEDHHYEVLSRLPKEKQAKVKEWMDEVKS